MTKSGKGSRRVPRRPGRIALAACAVTASVAISAGTVGTPTERSTGAFAEAQSIQRRYTEVVVSFEFDQTNATTDQVSIVFTNTPFDAKRPTPRPVSDAVQEFSFSGRDYPKGSVSFSRRVPDKSFLECRFIRVVNRGTNRWFPSTISMVVDGQRVLDRLSMYPRKGSDPRGGIERWGSSNPTYWETDLQRFRSRAS